MRSKRFYPNRPSYHYGFDVARKNWIPFRPQRFVYHLTPGYKETCDEMKTPPFKRLSILLEGLHGSDAGTQGVWANNQMSNLWNLYPINIDSIMYFDKTDLLMYINSFDIWQIDTEAFKAKWFIDPNHMLSDPKDMRDWVFTESSVPPHALKLFRFKVDINDFFFTNQRNLRFELMPIHGVNRLLNHQRFRQKKIVE
jgi:hypothetical protein